MVDVSQNFDVASESSATSNTNILDIQTVETGVYEGFNLVVATSAKFVVITFVAILVFFPDLSATSLDWFKDLTVNRFANWYNYLLAALLVFVCVLVVLPVSGRLKLGKDDSEPDYSRASWLSMMFCAGIGGGIVAFSVSEPISHFSTNPDMIAGTVQAQSEAAAIAGLKYVYLHWGLSAWACYALIGLVLGVMCHRFGQPLTMRSGLTPIFGKRLEGAWGNVVDTLSILAIISGITTTIALGVEQICSGISELTGSTYFSDNAGSATLTGLLTALVAAMSVAVISVLSGVTRGVKWMSQIGLMLAVAFLCLFVFFGAGFRTVDIFFETTLAYFQLLPEQFASLSDPNLSATAEAQRDWQNDWTIFYWAWWIAFAPFVGIFLAKISRGRTVREFLLGAVLAPTTMCFVWFAGTGGSALLLELDGTAQGAVQSADHAFRIYAAMEYMLPNHWATAGQVAIVLLFLVLVVSSTTAAILAIKAIGSAGVEKSETKLHSVVWACVITAFAASVMVIGGVTAVRDMMIISALPFSVIMALKACSVMWLLKKAGEQSPA